MSGVDGRASGYLLDTATCGAILRRSDAGVMERLGRREVSDISISAVTLAELVYGAEVSRRSAQERAALEVLLKHVRVLDFTREMAEDYGFVRMVLELSEAELGAEEMLVAAQARRLGMTLVSAQARALRRVAGMAVESWG